MVILLKMVELFSDFPKNGVQTQTNPKPSTLDTWGTSGSYCHTQVSKDRDALDGSVSSGLQAHHLFSFGRQQGVCQQQKTIEYINDQL